MSRDYDLPLPPPDRRFMRSSSWATIHLQMFFKLPGTNPRKVAIVIAIGGQMTSSNAWVAEHVQTPQRGQRPPDFPTDQTVLVSVEYRTYKWRARPSAAHLFSMSVISISIAATSISYAGLTDEDDARILDSLRRNPDAARTYERLVDAWNRHPSTNRDDGLAAGLLRKHLGGDD